MHREKLKLYKVIGALFLFGFANAQTPIDTLVEMKGIVEMAARRYHLLKAGKYEADAAAKNIDLTKYSRLPNINAGDTLVLKPTEELKTGTPVKPKL